MQKKYLTLKHTKLEEAEIEINEYAKLNWEVKSFFFNDKIEKYITLLEGDDNSIDKSQSNGPININTTSYNSYTNYGNGFGEYRRY